MPEESIALFTKVLKTKGYSLTKPRKIVANLLWGKEPLSIHELSQLTQNAIDRASLYRTVNLFERLGIVHRIYLGWKYKIELSDILTHHHHHISCVNCGKIIAITEEVEVESLIDSIAKRQGFEPSGHQLEIRGYCPACRGKQSD